MGLYLGNTRIPTVGMHYAGLSQNNQSKTVNPSGVQQLITYDSGYTGLEQVTVNAISPTYVGTGITQRTSSDLTVSGATVTAPAGYYASAASASVSTMTLPTSTSSSATSGYTSKATISRNTSDQYINIPIGYNSTNSYYKISAIPDGVVQAPASISGSSATISAGTNTITLSKTISVTPNVTTSGYITAGTTSNSSVSLTASVTTKAAATITPTTTNQTIASGTYLTGAQTISGDANLIAGNIKSGVKIFNVTGTYSGTAVSNQNKTVTPTTSQQTITADSGYTGLGTVTVNRIPTDYLIPSGNKSITANGTGIDVANYATVSVNVPVGSTINNQNKTVSPTTSQQTVTFDSGYTGLGTVTVNAMPIMTLPTSATASATSGFTSKATISRSTSDQYINIPTGYNNAGAYYKVSAVPNGSAGTPTASKGTVSNHSISITPSVTNTTGYISGGTKTGTAVTVSASELVSGTKYIASNGTNIDVINYATVDVSVVEPLVVFSMTYNDVSDEWNGVCNYQWDTVLNIIDSGDLHANVEFSESPGQYHGATVDLTIGFEDDLIIYHVMDFNGAPFFDIVWDFAEGDIWGVENPYRSSADLIVNGATVTVPNGYYQSGATASVSSGTTGTPTATKGTVSNHSIHVTPSVTNTTGYITGGTKTGTAVRISASELVSGNKAITANGTNIDVTNYSTVSVNVPVGSTINNETSSITLTPTESQQLETVTYDSSQGYTGLDSVDVIVEAIPSDYVGSGITRRTSSNLSASGATVTVPAGYYASQATKSVASGSVTGPTSLSGSSATVSTGTNTITLTKTGVSTTPTVSAGYVSSATSSTATVALTASVTTKAAATITPGTTAKEIAAGTYLTGKQTISGDANLVAGNIKSGVSIFGVSGSYSGTTISNQNKTITPTETEQSVSADSGYTGLGTVTIEAISSTYVGSGVATQAAKTVTPTTSEQTAVAANTYTTGIVKVAAISTETKTATPSTSTQNITPTSGKYLTKVTVNPIPSNYITTSDADAVAANILYNKTAYVNGSKITGTMANNGATGGTITTQGGTYTIPAGYTSGGTVTASLTASTLTNSIINGTAYEEDTGDYAWRTTVNIPAGYHNATTLTKDFSTILPAPDTPATASQILIGYQVYNNEGQLVTGTMANNTYSNTLNDTRTSVTIPAGYHDGTGTVSHTTVNIPDPTISVNTSTGVITASGSWTKGFTTDSSYSNTKALTTVNGTTVTPTTSEQTIANANVYTLGALKVAAIPSNYVNVSSITKDSTDLVVNGAIVTAPAGYYPDDASASVTAMTLPTAVSSTRSYTNKLTINRSTSAQYLNIPAGYNATAASYTISAVANGSVTAPSTISGTAATVSTGTNTITLTKSVSVTPNVTTAGYISAGTAGNASVTLTANVTTKAAATITPGTSNQTIASGTYLTGAQTIAGDADLIAANIKSGVQIFNVTGTYTSDATATAADIIEDETAYVDGRLVTGTMVIQTYYTGSAAPSSSLGSDGDIYLRS